MDKAKFGADFALNISDKTKTDLKSVQRILRDIDERTGKRKNPLPDMSGDLKKAQMYLEKLKRVAQDANFSHKNVTQNIVKNLIPTQKKYIEGIQKQAAAYENQQKVIEDVSPRLAAYNKLHKENHSIMAKVLGDHKGFLTTIKGIGAQLGHDESKIHSIARQLARSFGFYATGYLSIRAAMAGYSNLLSSTIGMEEMGRNNAMAFGGSSRALGAARGFRGSAFGSANTMSAYSTLAGIGLQGGKYQGLLENMAGKMGGTTASAASAVAGAVGGNAGALSQYGISEATLRPLIARLPPNSKVAEAVVMSYLMSHQGMYKGGAAEFKNSWEGMKIQVKDAMATFREAAFGAFDKKGSLMWTIKDMFSHYVEWLKKNSGKIQGYLSVVQSGLTWFVKQTGHAAHYLFSLVEKAMNKIGGAQENFARKQSRLVLWLELFKLKLEKIWKDTGGFKLVRETFLGIYKAAKLVGEGFLWMSDIIGTKTTVRIIELIAAVAMLKSAFGGFIGVIKTFGRETGLFASLQGAYDVAMAVKGTPRAEARTALGTAANYAFAGKAARRTANLEDIIANGAGGYVGREGGIGFGKAIGEGAATKVGEHATGKILSRFGGRAAGAAEMAGGSDLAAAGSLAGPLIGVVAAVGALAYVLKDDIRLMFTGNNKNYNTKFLSASFENANIRATIALASNMDEAKQRLGMSPDEEERAFGTVTSKAEKQKNYAATKLAYDRKLTFDTFESRGGSKNIESLKSVFNTEARVKAFNAMSFAQQQNIANKGDAIAHAEDVMRNKDSGVHSELGLPAAMVQNNSLKVTMTPETLAALGSYMNKNGK